MVPLLPGKDAKTVTETVRLVGRGTAVIVPPRRAGRLAAVVCASVLAAGPPPDGLRAQFASGVDLVEVYATVAGSDGALLHGLTTEDFTVEEDGIPQTIAAFSAGEFPLAVAVAIDRSFSMAPLLPEMREAASSFVARLTPDDEVALIAVGSETEIVSPLSRDHQAAQTAVGTLGPWGTTPLFDAVARAVEVIQAARGRRALVLLSDGAERYSTLTAAALLAHVRRRDVLVYPVAVGRVRPAVFAELAAATGGRSFHVTDGRRLPAVLEAIGTELRFQYLIGYSPTRPPSAPGHWRRIRVSVRPAGARVRAREGYWG